MSDATETDVRQKQRLMPCLLGAGHNNTDAEEQLECCCNCTSCKNDLLNRYGRALDRVPIQLYRAGQSHLRTFETETAPTAAEAVGVCRNAALCRKKPVRWSVGRTRESTALGTGCRARCAGYAGWLAGWLAVEIRSLCVVCTDGRTAWQSDEPLACGDWRGLRIEYGLFAPTAIAHYNRTSCTVHCILLSIAGIYNGRLAECRILAIQGRRFAHRGHISLPSPPG